MPFETSPRPLRLPTCTQITALTEITVVTAITAVVR